MPRQVSGKWGAEYRLALCKRLRILSTHIDDTQEHSSNQESKYKPGSTPGDLPYVTLFKQSNSAFCRTIKKLRDYGAYY
jgi:hypothetical protein